MLSKLKVRGGAEIPVVHMNNSAAVKEV